MADRTDASNGRVKGQPLRFIKGHHARLQTGPRQGNWKGGRKLERGYVVVLESPGGRYLREHRLVLARHLGRPLMPSEVVHHVNGDRADNRLENLWLFPDNASHKAWHRLQRSGLVVDVFMPALPIAASAARSQAA